jgi:hypothetical protein
MDKKRRDFKTKKVMSMTVRSKKSISKQKNFEIQSPLKPSCHSLLVIDSDNKNNQREKLESQLKRTHSSQFLLGLAPR